MKRTITIKDEQTVRIGKYRNVWFDVLMEAKLDCYKLTDSNKLRIYKQTIAEPLPVIEAFVKMFPVEVTITDSTK